MVCPISQPTKTRLQDIFLGRDPSSPGYDVVHPGHPRVGPLISAPATALLAYGYQARVLYVEPDASLVIVTMGQTVGKSLWNGGCEYDEGYTLTKMAQAWQPATHADSTIAAEYATMPVAVAAGAGTGAGVLSDAAPGRELGAVNTAEDSAGRKKNATGSCYCFCPSGEGFGPCFDMFDGSTGNLCRDAPMSNSARQHCPAVGVVRQCGLSTNCTGLDNDSDFGLHGARDCTVLRGCGAPHSNPDPFNTLTCSCRAPVGGGFDHCQYNAGSCASQPASDTRWRLRRNPRRTEGFGL